MLNPNECMLKYSKTFRIVFIAMTVVALVTIGITTTTLNSFATKAQGGEGKDESRNENTGGQGQGRGQGQGQEQEQEQELSNQIQQVEIDKKAPIAISGDNVYIVWFSNQTGNDEVNFRASTDNGVTFADKINLSNTTGAESQDAEIAAEGDNVIVTWWERNATSEEPVARISTDDGATFGPLLRLATNGTIGVAAGSG